MENTSVFYKCKLENTSSVANQPPNATFWDVIVPVSPNRDITAFVETTNETEIGSGEVRSLSLRFNADRGAFITETNNGITPIIDEFDRITLKITDEFGTLYLATYEVDIIHPTQDGKQGTVLPVDLLGPESHLQKTLFSDQFFFKSMFETSKGIINLYNKNKGINQVRVAGADATSLEGGFNDLPQFTANDYTFNLNEKFHYDGLIEVIDRGGSSVAAQGAGDFFELAFTTNPTNVDEINFRGFSSGNPSDQISIPNIKSDSVVINPAEQEGEIRSTVGTVTGTWCAEGTGTLPRQNADFIGGLEAWQLLPEHIVGGGIYPKDSIILVLNTKDAQGDNFHYKANKNTALIPPIPQSSSNADWDQYFFTQFLTLEVGHTPANYSFWTDAKSIQWRSNGAKTGGNIQEDPPTDNSIKVWDSNQVKIDGKNAQTWADLRALNFAAIGGGFKRNGKVYRGFRVLVDGVGTAEFAGFDNKLIQWNGEKWLIFKNAVTDLLVGVDDESRTYQFNGTIWVDKTTSLGQANDVYHSVYNITNTQGHNHKSNGIVGGTNATATATSFASIVGGLTLTNGGSGYTGHTQIKFRGNNGSGSGASAFATISGGVITNLTLINGGFGYTNPITVTIEDVGENYGQSSAVTYEFRYKHGDSISLTTPSFYRQFAGVNFRVPYPFNSNNGNTIGRDYGNSDELLPATFEAENMGLTSSGFSGFNNTEAEDLGPYDALTLFIKHEWRYKFDGTGGLLHVGNLAYRCALYDIDDTVVTQDFVIPFNGLWAPISLPIGDFKTYKARAAWTFGNAIQNIFLKELEILDSFRWRNIKKIAIHWLGPYDDQGRYHPPSQGSFLFPSIIDTFLGSFVDGYNIKLSIDSFQWSKPGLSVSPPDTERTLQPLFFYEPFITNKFQNDQSNLAKLEIAKFRHKEYEITSILKNDIPYGASFFLESPKMVKEAARTTVDLDIWITGTVYTENENDVQDSSIGYRCIKSHTSSAGNKPPNTTFWSVAPNPFPNTIKLVNKKNVRLIDKIPDGAGGALNTRTGIKRYV